MITIYGKENCPWCTKAKELAEQYSLRYEYFDIGIPAQREALFARAPDTKVVPQIWWYGRHIGGYSEFATEVENTLTQSNELF